MARVLGAISSLPHVDDSRKRLILYSLWPVLYHPKYIVLILVTFKYMSLKINSYNHVKFDCSYTCSLFFFWFKENIMFCNVLRHCIYHQLTIHLYWSFRSLLLVRGEGHSQPCRSSAGCLTSLISFLILSSILSQTSKLLGTG